MNKPSKLCWYDKLSCTNMRDWEDNLIQWGEKNNFEGCMIFNPEVLNKVVKGFQQISGKSIVELERYTLYWNGCRIKTENLVIEYFEITVRKALLANISIRDPETLKEKLIYTVPDEWNNSIWYAF